MPSRLSTLFEGFSVVPDDIDENDPNPIALAVMWLMIQRDPESYGVYIQL